MQRVMVSVTYVDAEKIKVRYIKNPDEELISFDETEKTYELTKFQKQIREHVLTFNLL